MTDTAPIGLTGTLALFGAGKMGGAMLVGWLQNGIRPDQVIVRDPHLTDDAAAMLASNGIEPNRSIDTTPAVIVLAVKPQVMDAVLPEVVPHVGSETLVISVAAGRTIESLAAGLPSATRIVRTIPNTPAAVGRGMTVCVAGPDVSDSQRDLCTGLMAANGAVAWLDDESLLDAVTGVSGSGPAYVFHMVEALAAAGVAAGLDADLASMIARQTVAGAGELLNQAEETAEQLRRNVTSPQGTTAAGLDVLMGDVGLVPLMTKTVAAATRRSRELAE